MVLLLRNALPLALLLAPARSLDNGVGITPPMGFNPCRSRLYAVRFG
jgi:hypothetical protein